MSELAQPSVSVTPDEVRTYLCACVAAQAQLPADQIRTDVPLSEYGLDSVYALTLCADIEDHYGMEIDSTVMWDHPRLDSLAEALAGLLAPR
ncbi:acyl carrier protein [Streptomyces sp. NBC_00365]|uniref:acyl carrier protein n=1 Tax=Streptomyces sp. NBC_00365 TaxID=2975726 RepID=UPI00224D11D3|nr:acyl carrier protein [Streptomyces sp. NBC_00365]MCX5096708.1 acyl carrier protein [Streptomyces sp. NBC_00365]